MREDKNTLKRLKLLHKLFRKQDAEKVAPHTSVFLSRAIKNGLIHRLIRGSYVNSFLYGFPRVEEVACFLKPPAYISCEWALNYHGIMLQSPQVCSVVTLSTAVGKERDYEYQGITIEFSKISPKLFEAFTFTDGLYMASPEKALLDTLYLHGDIPAQDELETVHLDFNALIKLAGKYPASVRRLLYELSGIKDHIKNKE